MQVKLYELKEGDKFYYYDNIIYVMKECIYDLNNPDRIEFIAKIFKTKTYVNMTISGMNAIDNLYYKYVSRDKSSYNAGFNAAINLCFNNMLDIEKEDAGIDNPAKIHIKMMESYCNWRKNK
jgi:hypothetical protein